MTLIKQLNAERARPIERRRHVVDYVVSAMASRLAPSNTLTTRYTPAPGLSVSTMISDIRKLCARLSLLGVGYSKLAESFSWSHPARALSSLIIATLFILKPYLLLGIPALLFFATVLAPGFAWQYPADISMLPQKYELDAFGDGPDTNGGGSWSKQDRRVLSDSTPLPMSKLSSKSSSILPSRTTSEKPSRHGSRAASIQLDRVKAESLRASFDAFDTGASFRSPEVTIDGMLDDELAEEPEEPTEAPPSKDFLKSVKDAQASISSIVAKVEEIEQFFAKVSSFEDSSSYAITLLVLCSLVLVPQLCRLLPVRKLIAGGLWVGVVAKHPIVAQETEDLPPLELESDAVPKLVDRLSAMFDTSKPPQRLSRTVEIFELQKQGLTPKQWSTVLYTPEVWPANSFERLAERLPTGVARLGDVLPPSYYEYIDGNVWQTDAECADWVKQRGLEGDIDGSFFVDGTMQSRWRRRRLIRTVRWQPPQTFVPSCQE